MSLDFKILFPEDFMTGLLDENLREDGRQPNEMRPVTLNIGSISTANGSAIVRIGSTLAMCGVQAELSDPHPTTPNEGFIVINVDYSNSVKILKDLSSSYIARTIEDLLINSKYIDLKDLLISEGKVLLKIILMLLLLFKIVMLDIIR
jgi:exosome complex component RRP43